MDKLIRKDKNMVKRGINKSKKIDNQFEVVEPTHYENIIMREFMTVLSQRIQDLRLTYDEVAKRLDWNSAIFNHIMSGVVPISLRKMVQICLAVELIPEINLKPKKED